MDHKAFFNDDIFGDTRSRFPSTTAKRWAAGECPPSLTESCQPLGTKLLSERGVQKKVLNTVVVNERRASEKEDRAKDDAAIDRLAARLAFAISPNSACCERVFALLKSTLQGDSHSN